MSDLKEIIKDMLDEECQTRKFCERQQINHLGLVTRCFVCHDHDSLASKIADRVREYEKNKV